MANNMALIMVAAPAPPLPLCCARQVIKLRCTTRFFFNAPNVLKRQYDFITCTEVVEHFHYPAREFQRLNDLLKNKGVLAIRTQFQTDDAKFTYWRYRHDPTHVVFYREHTFQVLAQQLGWQCEIVAPNVVFMHKPPREKVY